MLDDRPAMENERTVPHHAPRPTLDFTIATLVTRKSEYEAMKQSFAERGFGGLDCEFLEIDNSGTTQLDAFTGLNRALDMARGRYVVLCHQDVRLTHDDRQTLTRRLAELTAHDETWAVAGNAGGQAPGRIVLRISDPHTTAITYGAMPARVSSLDENLLIVRRETGVRFSSDLSGFHFYGTDLCLNAAVRGFSSYVIDFHLTHLSPGNKDASFFAAERAFAAKWNRVLSPRWLQTTCAVVPIGGSGLRQSVSRVIAPVAGRVARRLHRARLKRHLANAEHGGEADGS